MDKIDNPHKLVLWKDKHKPYSVDLKPTEVDNNLENLASIELEPLPMSKMDEKLEHYAKEKTGDAIHKVKTPKAEPENTRSVATIESLAWRIKYPHCCQKGVCESGAYPNINSKS